MNTINDRFREIRESLGKSQEEFASKASRTRSEIKNIEYGKTTPKPEVIQAICLAWNIDRIWLETGAGDPFRPLDKDEQIAAVLGQAIAGPSTARDRLIRALARLPEDAFPLIEQFILDAAASIANEKKE